LKNGLRCEGMLANIDKVNLKINLIGAKKYFTDDSGKFIEENFDNLEINKEDIKEVKLVQYEQPKEQNKTGNNINAIPENKLNNVQDLINKSKSYNKSDSFFDALSAMSNMDAKNDAIRYNDKNSETFGITTNNDNNNNFQNNYRGKRNYQGGRGRGRGGRGSYNNNNDGGFNNNRAGYYNNNDEGFNNNRGSYYNNNDGGFNNNRVGYNNNNNDGGFNNNGGNYRGRGNRNFNNYNRNYDQNNNYNNNNFDQNRGNRRGGRGGSRNFYNNNNDYDMQANIPLNDNFDNSNTAKERSIYDKF
jgi:hypothetical protein